ncbi:MAG: hypothetical protein U9R17_01510 [Thermodesulfobacteriota bacterium]|nr:hypothetical protein [Thermodesulfobacteriota bacterium]
MIKVILGLTVAAVFAFTGNVMASPPVCPPFEGFYIETVTDVTVYGSLSETTDFEWNWNNDACQDANNGLGNGLQANESVGRITYSEEFDSYNGLAHGDGVVPTTLNKTFVASTHLLNSDNNLDVELDIGYQSDGGAGSQADLTEITSVEVVSAGGALQGATSLFAGVLALCPWATTSNPDWPATNEGIAMGSRFHVPSQLTNGDPGYITFASNTEANVTEQVAMHYDVTADGKGTMESEMIARLWEGSSAGTTNATPLNSVATFQEYVKVDGIFQFHKGMTYRTQFAAPSITPVDATILE